MSNFICLYCNPNGLDNIIETNNRLWFIPGELRDKESYASYLASSDTVIHLAAATGKAPRKEYSQVNVNGT